VRNGFLEQLAQLPEMAANGEVVLPFPPAFVQKAGLVLGAPLGRVLGYGATYVPAESAAVAATA
jgi:hypothetical protein